MKIKTPFFIIEFEIIFLIVFFSFILSNEIKKMLFSFYICYLFIIFHELSHVFFASLFGKKMKKFKFTLSGVNINFSNICELEKYKEIIIYIAGPLSNFLLAIIFYYNKMIFEVNIFLGLINLLPIYPLDGYNILVNILRGTRYYNNKRELLDKIQFILIVNIVIVGLIQLIFTKNISIIIFIIYIIFISFSNKKRESFVEILRKNTY